jgi:hypothetical protein
MTVKTPRHRRLTEPQAAALRALAYGSPVDATILRARGYSISTLNALAFQDLATVEPVGSYSSASYAYTITDKGQRVLPAYL